MKIQRILMFLLFSSFFYGLQAQESEETKPFYTGTVSYVEYVTPMSSRPNDLLPPDDTPREAKDKRSIANQIVMGQDPQVEDDYFVKNRNAMEQGTQRAAASLVFDSYTSSSQPTDPDIAVGPNHVMIVYNTGFMIYDKSGNILQGQTAPNPAIFPAPGCCDLTVSYDNAADRWVVTFLSTTTGAQIAVSDGSNPLTSGWYIYTIAAVNDYQKLSVWSDGYYITENTGGSNKVWALERSQMLLGNLSAKIVGFNLPGIVTSGFFSPQVLNVTDNNLPAAGGATVVYMQDNAWSGVTTDHIKVWTINVNWANTASSTISTAQQITVTPFISVFDNGSFSNLTQPGGGIAIDALQATIMNQAQFRKFAGHNSALFNFVVDADATSGERAAIRWMEFRQSGDNQPWSLYQEGTYAAADGKHAWNGSLAMDAQGNIGMGYTSMSGPTTATTVRVGSFFTGRLSSDPLGTMTSAEQVIANGNANISGSRYGDYAKIDVDPSDNSSFWYITEYNKSGRKGVVGKFQIQAGPPDTQAPTTPANLIASNIAETSLTLTWIASTDNVGVTGYEVFKNGVSIVTVAGTSANITGLTSNTAYTFNVRAFDAAGNNSPLSNTANATTTAGGGAGVIAAYYFETGFQGWSDGGSDCARILSAPNSYEGSYSIRLRDDSSSSISVSPILNLTGNTQISIEFHTKSVSFENGEDFFVEFYNGSSYQVVGQYVAGTHFSNGSFFTGTIVLNSSSYTFNANNRIRFRADASANDDLVHFDQVIVSGDNVSNAPITIPNEISSSAAKSFSESVDENVRLYPNPAKTSLTIEILDMSFNEIIVISALGQLVKKIDPSKDSLTLDVSQLSSGIYFVQFVSDGLAVTKRFIKE